MQFSSIIFLFFFFPVVFVGYYLLKKLPMIQAFWLFLASLLFFGLGSPVYIVLMLTSILINWVAGLLIVQYDDCATHKKRVLILACGVNVFLLFAFKYIPTLLLGANNAFATQLPELTFVLPLGISFFTLQAISYLMDVYRKTAVAQKNPLYVGLYISFFPLLLAGPVVRYHTICDQLCTRNVSFRKCSVGLCRFVIGLAKKVLLANNLAVVVNLAFNNSLVGNPLQQLPVLLAWIGCIALAMQVYYELSGLCDMAIGLGLVFGLKLDENFNYPYFATSLTDFWQRFQISLLAWFNDYVFRPLGGSVARNQDKTIRNLFILWLLIGAWYGAGLTFILWGIWHFAFQLAEQFFGYNKNSSRPMLMRVYTLLVVGIGWVLLRSHDMYQAGRYFMNMFWLNNNTFQDELTWFVLSEYWVYLAVGAIFCLPVAQKINNKLVKGDLGRWNGVIQTLYPVAMIGLFIVCIAYIVPADASPFVFFNF